MLPLFYFKRGVFKVRGSVLLESTRGNVCDFSFDAGRYETGLVARVSTYISLEVFERLVSDCSACFVACFFACERSFGSETLFRGRYTRCGTASVATTGVLVPCALVAGAFAPFL